MTIHRFAFSSGKGQMAYSWQTRRRTVSIKVTTMLRSLYILGIIFAVVGIVAALRLFNIRTSEDFYQAQRGRRVSNEVRSVLRFSAESDLRACICSFVSCLTCARTCQTCMHESCSFLKTCTYSISQGEQHALCTVSHCLNPSHSLSSRYAIGQTRHILRPSCAAPSPTASYSPCFVLAQFQLTCMSMLLKLDVLIG